MLKQNKWLIPSVVALLLAVTLAAGYLLSRPIGGELAASMTIQAETSAGTQADLVAADSAFLLTSGYRINESHLRAVLEIEPPVDFHVEGSGKNWRIIPDGQLEENTVYTMRLKSDVGTPVQSFAFQTISDLLIASVFPYDGATFVDVTTGIELQFNTPDVDISGAFEIVPPTPGRFETTGLTARFIPDRPLAPDSVYRISLRAGLTAPNGTRLQQSASYSFETTTAEGAKAQNERLRLAGDFSDTFLAGDQLAVLLRAPEALEEASFTMTLHRFAGVNLYAKQLRAYDQHEQERAGRIEQFTVPIEGMEQVLEVKGGLLPADEYGDLLAAPLPDGLPEGQYLFTIRGGDEENPQFVQKLFQVVNLSIYTQSAGGELLVWINDPLTGRPVQGASVDLEDRKTGQVLSGVTQSNGTVRLLAGETKDGYLKITREGSVAGYEPIRLVAPTAQTLDMRYYAALYTDRTLYQPDDTVRFWGVLQPRTASEPMPTRAEAALTSYNTDGDLARISVQVAPDGTFSGSLPFSAAGTGGAQVRILAGDEVYTAQYVQISSFVKPPYQLEMTPDQAYYYFNQPISFTLQASYFDGLPTAGAALRAACSQTSIGDQQVHTSTQGQARVTGTLRSNPSGEEDQPAQSWQPQEVYFSATTDDERETNVFASGTVTVLPSKYAIGLESSTPGTLTVRLAELDPSKLSQAAATPRPFGRAPDLFTMLHGGAVDLPATLYVHREEYRQTVIGSSYDLINKRVFPRYKTERIHTIDQVLPVQTQNGVAMLQNLPTADPALPNVFFWYELRINGGVSGTVSETANHFYRPMYGTGERYTFAADALTAGLGQTFELGLFLNGNRIPNQGQVLYTLVQQSTLDAGVFTADRQQLTMQEAFLPNLYAAGAYFDGRHTWSIQPDQVTFDSAERALQVAITTDKESYQPGETAQVRLQVTDAAGAPAAAAVCVGVVDEALFALSGQTVDLRGQMYASIYTPHILQNSSSANSAASLRNTGKETPEAGMMDGAANAGELPARSRFLDTAAFQSAVTDATGQATLAVVLPDNMTSWRITAAAAAGTRVGDAQSHAIVSRPFYLRPIVSGSYLAGDDLAVSALAVYPAELAQTQLTLTGVVSDAAGREVDRLSVTGQPGSALHLNFGKYDQGAYKLTLEAHAGAFSDKVELPFSVIQSGLLVPAVRSMQISDLATLRSAAWPVRLTIYDDKLQTAMDALEWLSGQQDLYPARLEPVAAAYRARSMQNELRPREERSAIYRDRRLDDLQNLETGGVRPVQAGGEDPVATAKMMMSAEGLLDMAHASSYLHSVLQDPAASAEQRAMAYVGLAAAKQPVLADLQRFYSQHAETLAPSTQLWIGAAFARLGQYDRARAVYTALSDNLHKEGDLRYVEEDGTAAGRIRATAAALALTSSIGDDAANGLARYLLSQQDPRSRVEELYCLELLLYVQETLPDARASKARVSYMDLDGKRHELDLSEKGYATVSMTAEQLSKAGFQLSNARASVLADLTECVAPATAAQGPVLVERRIEPLDGDSLTSGARAQITLRLTFPDDAPEGLYLVSDYVPSGMRYLQQTTEVGIWPLRTLLDNEGQTVRGYVYYTRRDETQPLPLTDAAAEVPMMDTGADQPIPAEKSIPETPAATEQEALPDHVREVTYRVSMSAPGSFITEAAQVTAPGTGLRSHSTRGSVVIEPAAQK